MAVACGITGLPNIGKTTLFNALTTSGAQTASYAFSTVEPNLAVVDVPDERLELLHNFVETEKLVPAGVRVVDIAGLAPGASQGEGMGNKFLGAIKETDAILHVVQCFERADLGRESPVDPAGDMDVLELELAMADLETVARNLERVSKKARTGDKESIFQQELFERARALLEEGVQLHTREWRDEEQSALYPLFLLTMKPVLYVANVADDDTAGESDWAQAVAAHAVAMGSDWLPLCCDIECELMGLEEGERAAFMEDMGVGELGLPRLIHATYSLLGLQTFFTAGPKEIKAWTIRRGDVAPIAAGVIHSDFEKSFIRAECYSVDDLAEHGSEVAIKAAGKLRVEGREYVMREAEVVHFLVGK